MWIRGLGGGMSPHTKGVASVWECSQDGLTCVASTASGCVKVSGAWASSNEVRFVKPSDSGRCRVIWNLFMDDLGLAGGQGVSVSVSVSVSNSNQDCDDIGAESTLDQAEALQATQNRRTYFSMTLLRPATREFHLKTLMGFSIVRGLGMGKSMSVWNN